MASRPKPPPSEAFWDTGAAFWLVFGVPVFLGVALGVAVAMSSKNRAEPPRCVRSHEEMRVDVVTSVGPDGTMQTLPAVRYETVCDERASTDGGTVRSVTELE